MELTELLFTRLGLGINAYINNISVLKRNIEKVFGNINIYIKNNNDIEINYLNKIYIIHYSFKDNVVTKINIQSKN